MSSYLLLKTLHVISAAVVFGTGVGIAWFTLRGWLSGDRRVFHWISHETVAADWLFTASAIVALLGSAAGMLMINPAWLQQSWLRLAMVLSGLVFLLWLPVVALQYRLRSYARESNGIEIQRVMKLWCILGYRLGDHVHSGLSYLPPLAGLCKKIGLIALNRRSGSVCLTLKPVLIAQTTP